MSTIVTHVQYLIEHDGNRFTFRAITDWSHFSCIHWRFVVTIIFHIPVGHIGLIDVVK